MGDRLATLDMGQKIGGGGCCAPFLGGAGSPCNTVWRGARPTPVPSGILIRAALWPQYMGQNWGCCAPLLGVSGIPIYHNVAWAEVYLRTKWYLNPSGRLAARDMGPHLTQCGWAEAYLHAKFHLDSIQPFGHNTPTSQTGQTTV